VGRRIRVNMNKKGKLGELLISANLITEEQLQEALNVQSNTHQKLGEILVQLNYVNEQDLTDLLSEQLGIPTIDLEHYVIEPQTVSLISKWLADTYKVVPLFKLGNTLNVAMVNPHDIVAQDEIRRETGLEVEPAICSFSAMEKALNQYYSSNASSLEDVINEVSEVSMDSAQGEELDVKNLEGMIQEGPVIRFVNELILQAVKDKASDIHIEPEMKFTRTRFRVDGEMAEVSILPKGLELPVISRIKVMAKLDIAKSRIPQDGRFELNLPTDDIGVRVSTFPTVYGENLVMRILNKKSVSLGINNLGLEPDEFQKVKELVRKPYGFLLVTGPTGSGKTTTLYAMLNDINTIKKNIITIEDPVEYQLEMIRQSQVNPKAGLTFAGGLRAILRQDPDVIMVGEIRDKETTDISIQAAMTGHLVLATFHTNDAPSALTRMVEMGVEPFLLASTVTGVIAQRLVRTLCSKCKAPFTPPPELLKRVFGTEDVEGTFFTSQGCEDCRMTGFKGRNAIFEVLEVNDEIRNCLISQPHSTKVREIAVSHGMHVLRESGLKKAISGETSLEEVIEVTIDEQAGN
jgi:type IV pilus assembly protein PilB